MVKSELITKLFERQKHFSLKDVEHGINAILRCMSDALSVGKRIEIRGFGSFSSRYHGSRKAHNPRTGDKLFTEGKYTPHFKPGKELRDRVNQNQDKPIKE